MVKRRSQGDGNIKHRTDGRWEARLTLSNGRRKSIYGKTQKEVRAKLGDTKKKVDAGIDLSREQLTVAQYLNEWLQDIKGSIRESTRTGYSSHVRTHLIPTFGPKKLGDLTAAHVNQMLRGMEDKGLSGRTRNSVRATLRKALNDAIKADLLISNAAERARAQKQQTKQVVPLSPEEVRELLRQTKDHRYGPLIHVAIGTGMRQGELLGLTWSNVDLDDESLKIQQTMQRVDGTPTFSPTKTDKSRRTIALDRSTVEALSRQKQMVEDLRSLAGKKWTEWDLVFPSTVGTPLNNSNVTHQFQQLVEAAGLPRQRFHDLRHCAASLLLSEGASLKEIQDTLGHSQYALTANTYTHLSERLKRDTAGRMGAALTGSTSAKGSE